MKKIFILTGEPSGDKLASKVISKLKKIKKLPKKNKNYIKVRLKIDFIPNEFKCVPPTE